MYVNTIVSRIILLKLLVVTLCIMEVVNHGILYNKRNSNHDDSRMPIPPPPPRGFFDGSNRKRKQACKFAAQIRAVASCIGGQTKWKAFKRTRTSESDGTDGADGADGAESPEATCLHGRDAMEFFSQGQMHHIDARMGVWNNDKVFKASGTLCEGAGDLVKSAASSVVQSPWRFMFYEKGDWVEYPEEASRVAWENLRAGSPTAEVTVQGRGVYLLNFSEMVQVNRQTGYIRSIAWIDDAQQCSVPVQPIEGPPMVQSSSSSVGDHHVDIIPVHKAWVNQHRASWRDGATNSMANCLLSSAQRSPGCEFQLMESVVSSHDDVDDSARVAVDTDFETVSFPANARPIDLHDTGYGLGSAIAVDCGMEPSSNGYVAGHSLDASTTAVGCASKMSHMSSEVNNEQRTDSVRNSSRYPMLGNKLLALDSGEEEFEFVKRKFIGGLTKFGGETIITGIYRDASPLGQARQQAFQRQQELTEQARGNANVRYAWHGTSKAGVTGIVLHGFGQPRTAKNGSAYGVGVYLAPENHAYVSCVYADNDENGEKHVVLCQVIVGACELVKPGSEQFHPSSEQFDTGVDDLLSPKRLIVWSTHMNTHILPVYVVSFKLPCRWHELLTSFQEKHRGFSKFCQELPRKPFIFANQICQRKECVHEELHKRSYCRTQGQAPTSASVSFPSLFTLLQPLMCEEKLQMLKHYYHQFKARKFPREKLIQEFRNVVGDHRLVHAIKLLQGHQMSKEQEQVLYGSPTSVPEINVSFASSLLHV